MRSIAHKVKIYRREFHPLSPVTIRNRIFWLTSLLVAATLVGFVWYLADEDHRSLCLFLMLLVSALTTDLGYLQIFVEAEKRRFELLKGKPAPHLRAAMRELSDERLRSVRRLFAPKTGIQELARDLISDWEWRKAINKQAGDPDGITVRKFFSLPSGSTLATYLGGFLAIIAGIVVVTLDREVIYAHLPFLWENFTFIWWNLLKMSLLLALMAIPARMLWSALQFVWEWAGQWLDDDYLSNRHFYRFIRDMLQLEDHRERRLLTTSSSIAYWFVSVSTAPISQLVRKCSVFAKARRIKNNRSKQPFLDRD